MCRVPVFKDIPIVSLKEGHAEVEERHQQEHLDLDPVYSSSMQSDA